MSKEPVRRVLIFRMGSLGDTIVALPALRLVARAFPEAERRILTNFPVSNRAPPLAEVLDGTDLASGFFAYPAGTRRPSALWGLLRELRSWKPDAAVYLKEAANWRRSLRDWLFLKATGARRVHGVPWHDFHPAPDPATGHVPPEWSRLVRRLGPLGGSDPSRPDDWDLVLSATERAAARQAVAPLDGAPFIVVAMGSKWRVNLWPTANWRVLLERLSASHPQLGLAFIGAPDDREPADTLAAVWQGPHVNLCGRLAVRESAAVLELAQVFVGLDSGPMHLAAAAGTRCVAIFSSRNLPGQWFPQGAGHAALYNTVDCAGCGLEYCAVYDKRCIRGISPDAVLAEIEARLPRQFPPGQRAEGTTPG
jgi:ADP-heptose:LPS heptosyltransferase